jgi:glycosyltransferase involved in cell wall biosynthesis
MARVNILMNCYNGAHYLDESIGSILSSDYQDFEIIFIDNCSTDDTEKKAKSFGPKVKYYKTPSFMSLCDARVWGMQFISAEFFSMLDADDLILPNKLREQVSIFDLHPEVGIVYGNSIHFKENGEEFLLYNEEMPSGNIFRKMLASYFLSLETLMARKSVMDKYGLSINPKYNIASDVELYLKLSFYTNAYYLNMPVAKWRMTGTSESSKQFGSFPKEYETLLEDLKVMVPNFENEYRDEIKNLNGIIHNMHGLAYWKDGDIIKSREHLKKAAGIKITYLIPLIANYIVSFYTYMRIRILFKRI